MKSVLYLEDDVCSVAVDSCCSFPGGHAHGHPALPPGKSASDHLIQFPEKSGGEKEGEAIDNFG